MIIQEIILKNFRTFKGFHTYKLTKLNLITGKIGSGKSTLGRVAITYCLFGESEVNMSRLPSDGEKSCLVELHFKHNGNYYEITREIPNKLTIRMDGVLILDGANNTDKDKWLKERFRDYQYFKKFRMIDLREGINILEEGKTSLRKTLISYHENLLSNIRTRLLEKKNLYDKFNKDTSVVFKHYPSEKRLERLKKSLKEYKSQFQETQSQQYETEKDYRYLITEQAKLKEQYKQQIDTANSLVKNPICPQCKQKLPEELKLDLLEKTSNLAVQYSTKLGEVSDYIVSQKEASEYLKSSILSVQCSLDSINRCLMRLEARLKQKDYKFTSRDVLIVSSAIKELDKFYSYFILQNVKSLEPIINTVISKIGFELIFKLDEKGDFDICLNRNGFDYTYKDLSSGERLLLSISFQISLLLDKNEKGLIICDEGFNNCDVQTVTDLYQLFSELPFQLISILHRFETESKDINIISLEGKNNGRE